MIAEQCQKLMHYLQLYSGERLWTKMPLAWAAIKDNLTKDQKQGLNNKKKVKETPFKRKKLDIGRNKRRKERINPRQKQNKR